jgi:hypothetical protein
VRDAGDEGRPRSNSEKRQNHLGQDRAVHAHETWPFGVLAGIARTRLNSTLVVNFRCEAERENLQSSRPRPSSFVLY